MNTRQSSSPSLYTVPGGVLSLSGPALREFLGAVLERDVPFRFAAEGSSMYPFIKDGDVITVESLPSSSEGRQRGPRLGDIVAVCHPMTGSLVVHRAIGRRRGKVLVRGDNCTQPDGLVDLSAVLGRVSRVERGGHFVVLGGRGPERLLVVGLARHNALIPLVAVVRRAVRPAVLCLRSLRQRGSA